MIGKTLLSKIADGSREKVRDRFRVRGLPLQPEFLAALIAIVVGHGVVLATQDPQFRSKTLLEQVEVLVFERVNEERTQGGLEPLLSDPTLTTIARAHSLDMLDRNYSDHLSPDGTGPSERVAEEHRQLVGVVAENIWSAVRSQNSGPFELANQIMDALMSSEGHRRTILTPELTHLGVGIYSALRARVTATEYRVTQLFAAVDSYTDQPVPRRLQRTHFHTFALIRPNGERAQVQYFDLWSEEEGLAVFGPSSLFQARIDADPGKYQLRFFYPLGERRRNRLRYRISSGPYVVLE